MDCRWKGMVGIFSCTFTGYISSVHHWSLSLVAPDTCYHVLDGSPCTSEVLEVMGFDEASEIPWQQCSVVDTVPLLRLLLPALSKCKQVSR